MPTNEERREAARKLRECRGGWSSGECYYTIIRALGLPDTSREDGGHALYSAIADLIEPDPERTIEPSAELGNYRSLRCPKCGGEVSTIVYDDCDWWDAVCDGCGYDFSFDPGRYIDFGAVQTDWAHQYAEEAANAD